MDLNKLRFPAWTVPIALLALAFVTYGPFIPWLGFYWDDWPYLWVSHAFGPGGFPDFVASDRPFSAWIFMITTAVFGEDPLPYHLLALGLRWLGAFLLWACLGTLWPSHVRQATWAAILFLVYPGFKQQPIALIYNHHWSVLVLLLFSLLTMLLAARRPKAYWLFTGLSLASSWGMFSLEYFVGLELLRPVLLWIALEDPTPEARPRLQKTLLHWLPYLAVLIIYISWRVQVFRFPTYQLEGAAEVIENPLLGSREFFQIMASDLVDVLFKAWGVGLRPPASLISGLAILVIVAIGTGIVVTYLLNLAPDWQDLFPPRQTRIDDRRWTRQAFSLGGIALLMGGFPAWLTDLPVHLNFPYDRMTLPFLVGISIFTAALIQLFVRPRVPQLVVLAVLISLSLALHVENTNTYRRDLERFRDFFWQLSWRAPSLQPGTIVLTHQEPLMYYSDNSLTAPLNWIYAPGFPAGYPPEQMPYMFYNIEVRQGRGLPALAFGLPVYQEYRSLEYKGSTSDLLVVYQNSQGCVRVIHPDFETTVPGMSFRLSEAIRFSDLTQIVLNGSLARPPSHLFGPEPVGTWCYYFEKADLARQIGDWQQVADLGRQALVLEEGPNDESEYIVFMEGFTQVRDWVKARELAEKLNAVPDVAPLACGSWERVEQTMTLSADEQALVTEVKTFLDCR